MNQFDSANYPTTEPTTLVIGDRWAWKRSDLGADYPPASYTLKYSLRLEGTGATEIEITATGSGADYLAEVSAVTTAGYTAGRYRWQAYITATTDATKRATLGSGVIDIQPNRDAATTDPRSYARITLDAIEAVLQGRAGKDQEEYAINNRSLKRTPIADLLVLRDRFREEVRHEINAERLAQGLGDGRRIGIRFRRV